MIPQPYVLGDMLNGLEIILSTLPESGEYVGGRLNIWTMRCTIPQSDRAAVVMYTFDDSFVTMHRAFLRAYGS